GARQYRHCSCYTLIEASKDAKQRNNVMKKALTLIIILVVVGGVLWVSNGWTTKIGRADPKVAKFNADAENLILGIQQYREFTGSYPTGNNIQIAKALLGRTEKKVLILTARK